jgi:VanZ family protein
MTNKSKNLGKTLLKILYLWLPPIIWGIFIFSFSSVTTPRVSEVHWQDFIVKKLAHFVEYAVFAVLLFRAIKGSGVGSKKALISALFFSVFYGITDEFHQSFTPGREPTVRDALIDATGSLVALLVVRDWLTKVPRKVMGFMVKLGINY